MKKQGFKLKILHELFIRRSSLIFLFAPLVLLRIFYTRIFYYLELFIQFRKTLKDKIQQRNFKVEKGKKYPKISFCITCMDRLGHLKKTLPKNLDYCKEYPKVEFIILNYGSKDDLHSWILSNFKDELGRGIIKYYRTLEPKEFYMSNAKNLSHDLASGQIVCNLDADNYLGKNFPFVLNNLYQKDKNFFATFHNTKTFILKNREGFGGRISLSKKNFKRIGGYHEGFVGWGNEDNEFMFRAKSFNLKFVGLPLIYAKAIYHSDFTRFKNYSKKTKKLIQNNWDNVGPIRRRKKKPKDLKRFY